MSFRIAKDVMTAKLFTPAEANRTLPLVRSIVADILEKARELRGRTALAKDPETDEELEQLRRDILDLMQELEDLGASYKDWDFQTGLVDFPARIDGREVLLCWRSDEPRVEWYHAREAGFAGRKRIPRHVAEDLEEV
jgi:hypothetical protein